MPKRQGRKTMVRRHPKNALIPLHIGVQDNLRERKRTEQVYCSVCHEPMRFKVEPKVIKATKGWCGKCWAER